MLFLNLRIGKDYYALPAADIVEILPLVNLKSFPQAPPGIAGLFDFRGKPVPVIDLTLLATGVNSRVSMTTRLAVVNYSPDGTDSNFLGLVAEEMTETFHAAAGDFVEAGVDAPQTRYLGPVIMRGDRMVQRINSMELLPVDLRKTLFQALKDQ